MGDRAGVQKPPTTYDVAREAVIKGATPKAGAALIVPTHLIERGSAGPARR